MAMRRSALRALKPLGALLDASSQTCRVGSSAAQRWQPQWSAMCRLMSSLPPHTELTMPALSPTMSQGNIASWQVKEGDEVAAGDVLCEVETDKATMAWENQDDGFVAKLLKESGAQDIPVGTPVLILVEDEEHVAAFKDYQPEVGEGGGEAQQPAAAGASSGSSQPEAAPEASGGEPAARRQKASSTMGPAARILLQGAGLSPDDLQPTGPHGIVTKGDVLSAIERGIKASRKPAAEKPAAKKLTAAEASIAPTAQQISKEGQQRQRAEQQLPQQPPPPRRLRVPDSQIRALLANRMLEKGEQIPAAWLRDWVASAEQRS